MGDSTDAILAFGFCLGEELPAELGGEDESFDFEEWVASELGFGWAEDVGPDFWKARREAVEAFPLEIITHCSYDYPMHFLAAKGTEFRAKRGYPVEVSLPDVAQEKIEGMRAFCDQYGITWEEPKWHIFSLWG